LSPTGQLHCRRTNTIEAGVASDLVMAGANALQGGEGNDLVWGSAGTDRHNASPGADQFLYRSEVEIGNGMDACDCILDANPAKSDQAFSWLTVNRSAEIRVVSPAEQFFDSWLSAFPPRLKDR
jgi:hypothetical protein